MSNGSIRSKSYSTASKENQWAAFDALPKSVRETLANATFAWAPYPINKDWQRGRWKTAKDLCKAISNWDREQIRIDRKRVWGR